MNDQKFQLPSKVDITITDGPDPDAPVRSAERNA